MEDNIVRFEFNYEDTFEAMCAFQLLGSLKCRIVKFLFERENYKGTFSSLTVDLGMDKEKNVSNVRKALIQLERMGLVYIHYKSGYDDDGNHVGRSRMQFCFLMDGWLDYLLTWYQKKEEKGA